MAGTDDSAAAELPGALDPAQLRELYTGPPGEFVTRRKGLVTALRDAGDKEAARTAAALRKPTTPAWVLNLLAADGRTAQELQELSDEITAAVAAGERSELRTLAAAQRLLVSDVLERAADLAATAGASVPPNARDTVEAAVRGVLTDPGTAEQLFTGLLVEIPDPDGAQELPSLAIRSHSQASAPPQQKPAPRKSAQQQPTPRKPAASTSQESDPEHAEKSAVERRRHLRAVREAGVAVRTAERIRARREKKVRELGDDRDRLAAELAALEQQLVRAERELQDADADVVRAESALRQVDLSEDS